MIKITTILRSLKPEIVILTHIVGKSCQFETSTVMVYKSFDPDPAQALCKPQVYQFGVNV